MSGVVCVVFICSQNSDAKRPPAFWQTSNGASGFYAQVGVQQRTESEQQSAAPRVHDLRQAKALNQDVEQCMHVCARAAACL